MLLAWFLSYNNLQLYLRVDFISCNDYTFLAVFKPFTCSRQQFIYLLLCFKRKLPNFWEKGLILLKSAMVFSAVSVWIDLVCGNSKYMVGNNLFSFVQRNRSLCTDPKVTSFLPWVTLRKLIYEFRNATWARTFRQFRKRKERNWHFAIYKSRDSFCCRSYIPTIIKYLLVEFFKSVFFPTIICYVNIILKTIKGLLTMSEFLAYFQKHLRKCWISCWRLTAYRYIKNKIEKLQFFKYSTTANETNM